MYSAELADVYEEIYQSRGKDWTAECALIDQVVRAHNPHARSLLDVACGTGAHLAAFGQFFPQVEGVEVAEAMRERAMRRLPGVPIHAADMRDFDLGDKFDAVVCMFCSIAYVSGVEDMRAAVRCMSRHLAPGAPLVIEPWWFPEQFIEGYVAGDLSHAGGRTVARISHSTLEGRATRMEVHFMVGDASGVRRFVEIDHLTLFTREEYEAAYRDAGCSVEFRPGPPTGRGLFVGVRD
jgi:dTDP-3-amino-3,4,6-trideoxy-alpha-D-glucopyranose N,N-dimethyltransferase